MEVTKLAAIMVQPPDLLWLANSHVHPVAHFDCQQKKGFQPVALDTSASTCGTQSTLIELVHSASASNDCVWRQHNRRQNNPDSSFVAVSTERDCGKNTPNSSAVCTRQAEQPHEA